MHPAAARSPPSARAGSPSRTIPLTRQPSRRRVASVRTPCPSRRRLLRALCAAPFAGARALGAQGAPWPARTVRLVVPWAPGGLVDTGARVLAEPLTRTLGQPVVVENVAGAAGAIGSAQVAKATPDGYTLLMGTSSL